MIENTKDIDELEFINSFSHSGKPVKDLSRIKALLSDLGDPQDSLKFVHIAGTNGKGSMAQMFSEVFQCAGLKTGLFTSPYIISYTDRIKINGIDIPKPALEMARQLISENPHGVNLICGSLFLCAQVLNEMKDI